MILDNLHIDYWHRARRYLREKSPAAYELATRAEIEHIANSLRYEDFRLYTQPYRQIREKLLTDFYSLQINPSEPQPEWLQERVAELDSEIARVAEQFGYAEPQGDAQK